MASAVHAVHAGRAQPPMTMSCPDVVYQAYYPYLYQRSAPSASAFPPFSHQYDRVSTQPVACRWPGQGLGRGEPRARDSA